LEELALVRVRQQGMIGVD